MNLRLCIKTIHTLRHHRKRPLKLSNKKRQSQRATQNPLPIAGGGMPLPIPGGGPPIGGGAIPPTPCTGAAPNPMGAPIPMGATPTAFVGGGAPLPTPLTTPGPPATTLPPLLGGGGPSTAILTTFSPLKMIKPKLRFSILSSITLALPAPFLERSVRNSSVSTKTRLRCLSKAKKVPTMVRLSVKETRRRCSM